MSTSIQHIASTLQADTTIVKPANIEYLLTDSRKLVFPDTSLFFALTTPQQDGHVYIPELIQRSVFNFVVEYPFDTSHHPGINFIVVPNVLQALQKIAAAHRKQFHYPVLGITGSNGKTIVKEWLAQLLSPSHQIVRNPRSYNSQIGVPLSVWEMREKHEFAIFEAGISKPGEMERLEKIIQPTIGILTNIGSAHAEGFESQDQKIIEKCTLFAHTKECILPFELLHRLSLLNPQIINTQKIITWGWDKKADVYIESEKIIGEHAELKAIFKGQTFSLTIPFTDAISVQNVIICWTTLLHLGIDTASIQQGVKQLRHLEMRMQIKKAVNQCYLLDDSYSNDLQSLILALDYAKQQAGNLPITLILSDFSQAHSTVWEQLIPILNAYPIRALITVGEQLKDLLHNHNGSLQMDCEVMSFISTADFLSNMNRAYFKEQFIVLKGARVFEFERIHAALQAQVHQTQVEVNLSALVNNYKKVKALVGPSVKMMAMVKAFGYGSGSIEVARILQFHHVDYLSVAYVDEGVELRKAGIHVPIMVMNIDHAGFDTLIQYHLEPEIFSLTLLEQFIQYIQAQGLHHFPVHLKLNTGMNRLGFDQDQIDLLCTCLLYQQALKVQTVFSHLSASGQTAFEAFTENQLSLFHQMAAKIETAIGYKTIQHIANSGAILMDAKYHLDMVRLGIGLYGVAPSNFHPEIVVQFNTTIAQIRSLKAGETVGYNRAGVLNRDSMIATVRLGYADGYARQLGRGIGAMWLNGHLAPIVGDICMDMTMIDITDIPNTKEGDMVEVFGSNLPIEKLAKWANTIPYEILTSIGQRVKRIYIQD